MQQRNLFRAMTTLGVALVGLWGAPAVRAQNATITPILPIGNATLTTAIATGANGTVVTGVYSGNGTTATPFIWTAGNGTQAFGDTANSTSVTPVALNDAGDMPVVVGTALTNGTLEPFVYNATTQTFIGLTPNGTDQGARAAGISDAGVVAVNGFGTNVTVFTGYIYAPDGSGNYHVTTLDGLGGVDGITRDSSALPYLDSGTKTAGIFYIGAPKTTAPTLAGNYSYSEVDAISPGGGYVVGVASNNATVGQIFKKGFIFDAGFMNATVLAPFNSGDVFAVCRTVSDDVAGGPIGGGASGTSSTFGNEKAVLYDIPLNATLDLKQLLLDLYGLDVSPNATTAGFTSLNEVHSISADGKTIVGDGNYAASNSTADIAAAVRTGFVVTLLSELPDKVTTGLAIVAQPSDMTVNIGTNATFMALAIPGGNDTNISYQWFKVGSSGNTSIHNAVSNTLVIANAQPSNMGDYICEISNSTDTFPTNTAQLTVNGGLPIIDLYYIKPKKAPLKLGSEFTLSANVKNAGDGQPTAYQWSFNGTAISGATGANYTVKKAKTTSGGNYTVTIVSPLYGNITSAVKVIHVYYAPVITTQPSSVTVTAGQPAQLSVAANGYPTPTYQWYIHNRAITNRPSAKKSIFNISVTHVPDGNIYRVRVTNSQGSVYSLYANLTVNPINPNGNGNNTTNGGGNNTGNNTFGGGG
jgi:hypothetical protein